MNCIKEKCKYCKEDDYKCSVFRCILADFYVFKKDTENVECIIDNIIANRKYILKKIEDYSYNIQVQNKLDILNNSK